MKKEFQCDNPQDLFDEAFRLRDNTDSSLQERTNFYNIHIKNNKCLPDFKKQSILKVLRI